LLERWPFLAPAVAALSVVAIAAGLVLPRLDGVEIRSATLAGGQARARVAFRLRSAERGRLVLIALRPDGEKRVAEAVEVGAGEVDLVISVGDARELILVAELRPRSSRSGLLDVIQRSRRRDARSLRGSSSPSEGR